MNGLNHHISDKKLTEAIRWALGTIWKITARTWLELMQVEGFRPLMCKVAGAALKSKALKYEE
jgi:hypothetical protein